MALTPFPVGKCNIIHMRSAYFSLLLISATLGNALAQSAPTLDVATDHEFYASDVKNNIYLESRIDLPDLSGKDRPILVHNIAFVLDRSGSMLGPRVESLRKAVSLAIGSLSERDIVSVVVFGSEIETLVEAKRRDQLDGIDGLLAQVEPSGGSALYDALNQGAAQVRRYATPSTLNHVILVTDGPSTKGPREADDFTHLVEAFSREGIGLSTVGIGEDFEEDLLANLARIGNGQFRFADKPESLIEVVPAEVALLCTAIAKDATLTLELSSVCSQIEAIGWTKATITDTTATYNFPYLYAGQNPRILTSVTTEARRSSYKLGTVRLSWKDVADGKPHEITRPLEIQLESDGESTRTSFNPEVARSMADAIVRQEMLEAIKQIDKGDFQRALRPLRRARSELYNLNYRLDDPKIAVKIRDLEGYLANVQTRGMNQLDRKILRSGLFNKFGIPTAEDSSDH
ncbi:MAG: VWA domain-containing protein [Verrucomicrobia bacterium]|nr:VWA domain-containing protein [Verrucomicrobiota bacterium]